MGYAKDILRYKKPCKEKNPDEPFRLDKLKLVFYEERWSTDCQVDGLDIDLTTELAARQVAAAGSASDLPAGPTSSVKAAWDGLYGCGVRNPGATGGSAGLFAVV